jgi:hypothetical protein
MVMGFPDEYELDQESLERLPDDWRICEAPSCTAPRRPPFVEAEDGVYCYRCFRIHVLGEDLSEIPD